MTSLLILVPTLGLAGGGGGGTINQCKLKEIEVLSICRTDEVLLPYPRRRGKLSKKEKLKRIVVEVIRYEMRHNPLSTKPHCHSEGKKLIRLRFLHGAKLRDNRRAFTSIDEGYITHTIDFPIVDGVLELKRKRLGRKLSFHHLSIKAGSIDLKVPTNYHFKGTFYQNHVMYRTQRYEFDVEMNCEDVFPDE